ncbi:hypothetical protein B0E45_21820 [Sinorhizobium sp. A49]|uniref:hypothetical protein n=1 Tax=Sinorhizobium sp. A49 TaxID=1945861 RepID=UPI0009857B49|nr:hypothetical protein [Sinorhizobium sp. A49]OOG67307.1 hypothetical protein B0E45_21820 [Sinorhizobium sp. A49]
MVQVVTVSATTAAYAAEAVKPKARVSGDGPADEAITLLSTRRASEPTITPVSVPKMKGALPLSLMLMSADGRLPQQSEAETLRRYLEYMRDDEDMSDDRENKSRQEDPAGQEDESGAAA